ncbi:hypothetical protein JDV02_000056 [Purpureocillium takamizusanense]|uniref:Uncharacterized protein n=1 Tax=Purpureocillium takamizusanense TaxID=2060973 RepID=A0A9Q8Q403_9HYPO|nr:uncharacterized protein JDV02_000056 [Purpureocillium takamizusanense]UNI13299.1 hypothetical protein JDV02_000056 [Purpureocillium takamizusanense]
MAFVAILLLLGICCYKRKRSGRRNFDRLGDDKTPARRVSETVLVDGYMRAVYADEEQNGPARVRLQQSTTDPPPTGVTSPSPPSSRWGLQDEELGPEHQQTSGLHPPGQVHIDRPRVQSTVPTEVTDTTESSWRTWQVDQSRATQRKDRKRSMFF